MTYFSEYIERFEQETNKKAILNDKYTKSFKEWFVKIYFKDDI